MKRRIIAAGGLLAASMAMVAAGCGSSSSSGGGADTAGGAGGGNAAGAVGSGATFPATAYTRWCQESATCNYAPKGSGGGIKDLTAGTVAWAGSDAPLTSSEQQALGGKVYYFPTLLGAIAIPTNITGVSKRLNLTGPALAGIFDGEISNWNDKDIAATNPGVNLPNAPIIVCVRADSSGTSFNFTTYLSEISQGFADKMGATGSKTPNWTAKTNASPGNPGVAQCVKSNPNSIGYVDLGDAERAGVADTAAAIGEPGKFVVPSVESISKAGDLGSIPEDLLVKVVNSPVKGAYPITATTWALWKEGGKNAADVSKAFTYFLGDKAQGELPALGFAPLPKKLQAAAQAQLSVLSQ